VVVGTLHYRFDIGGEGSQYRDELITEEDIDMPRDKLADLVGDGQARVTCSFELSDKDFGSGFGAHVSVTLTCNQEEKDVDRAADLASSLACKYTAEAVDTARAVYQSTLGRKQEPEQQRDRGEDDAPRRWR